MPDHYNQKKLRDAEFIRPPNMIKQKVGQGGLSEAILNEAQRTLDNNNQDFEPLAKSYLAALMIGIDMAKEYSQNDDPEHVIASMIYPSMQLKANGGMFKYDLITHIANKLIQFLEVITEPDVETVEMIIAFHTTMDMVIKSRLKGDGGVKGEELINALTKACDRYFKKHVAYI